MRTGRIVLFFLFAFGSIIVPVVGALLYAALTFETPFHVNVPDNGGRGFWQAMEETCDAIEDIEPIGGAYDSDSVRIQLVDGGQVTLIKVPSDQNMDDALSVLWQEIPSRSAMAIFGRYYLYERADNQRAGVMFDDGPWIVISEADSELQRESQLRQIPCMEERERHVLISLGEIHLGKLLTGIGAYVVLLLFVWTRMASWAASVDRLADARTLPASELRSQLLAIHDLDMPWLVRPGNKDNELIVEWKYADARWAGIMAAGGIRAINRIKLRLDEEASIVRAQDNYVKVAWQVAGDAGGAIKARLSGTWFKGIHFVQVDAGFIGGLVVSKDGTPTVDSAYAWKYSVQEMKKPLIDIVTRSGWDWRPVITFLRVLSG